MAAGAIAQLMGFVTVPDFKQINDNMSLLKFRLAFSRKDFASKKIVTDFVTVTAFGRIADRIFSGTKEKQNYICCFCDIRVSKYKSKTGTMLEHTEFIVNDYRMFSKLKEESNAEIHEP